MALRKTFEEVIESTRNEARISTNSSRGVDHLEHIKQVIRRHYQLLAEDWDWQHLELKRTSAVSRAVLQAGQRFYNFPAAVNPQKITKAWVKWGNVWQPVEYGITYDERSAQDPDNDQRTDPVTNWQFYDDAQFEVWPIPATNGVANGTNEFAFEGQKQVEQLVALGNRLDLDDVMVYLYAAAEILAENGQKDSSAIKASAAAARRDRMRGNLGSKTRYAMGLGRVVNSSHAWPRHPKFIR